MVEIHEQRLEYLSIRVEFDETDDEGFLVTRYTEFTSITDAMAFVRRLKKRASLIH